MNKKSLLTITMIVLTALAPTAYNFKLLVARAQTSSSSPALTITGLVENPLNLTLEDLQATPQTTETAPEFCVDAPNTPLRAGDWTGVELAYLLQQANVSSEAVKVAFFSSSDGYSTDLPVQTATQDTNILVAYQFDNTPINGLQLVVPGEWGYKWISTLTQIQLVDYNFLGTTETEGYPDSALVVNTLPILSQSTSTTNSTAPTQSSTPTPTASPQSPPLTGDSTTAQAASIPKPQSTPTFLVYVATVSAIIVVSAVVSTATLTKRKKAKTLKQ